MAAALFALAVCAAALANDTAVGIYDAVTDLLTATNNVTLSVNAEFSLDGQWFKTAEGTWKQDGDRTWRKLHLRSPKADGTERENGYTIVTEGDAIYLIEDFYPAVYRTGSILERDAILRNTVESEQLINLGRILASQADLLLGEGAVTKTDDGARITLGEDTPDLVNIALNQAFMLAAKRYFGFDYDEFRMAPAVASLRNFGTVTQGILYCVRNVAIRSAEVTLKTNQNGELEHAEGNIGLYLATAEDGVCQLDVTFRADVTDRGTTVLKRFNPDDYGVALAEGSAAPVNGEAEPQPASDAAMKDQMCLEAMRVWQETGIDMREATTVSCEWAEFFYEVSIKGSSEGTVVAHFTEDGRLSDIGLTPNDWERAEDERYNFEAALDEETNRKAKAFMRTFLENVHPYKLEYVKDFELDWTCTCDSGVYAMYEEFPRDENGNGVTFVIRLGEDMRIENYCCISNG